MDLYSGSHPVKFFSFRLDMSNEENLPESTNSVIVPDNETQEEPRDVLQEVIELDKEVRPESQASNFGCSTDESVITFIERTVSQFPSSQATLLDPVPLESLHETVKSSESDPLMVTVVPPQTTTDPGAEETHSEIPDQ